MPPVSVTIFASDPGTYYLEDDGIPGNNFSRIRFPDGTFVAFEHPTDDLIFDPSVAGVTLVINLTDSLGTANFTTGVFDDPLSTPDAIVLRNINTTAGVTLISNGTITEDGNDAAADITAGTLIMSAASGVGTPGNAIETRVGVIEAETTTGGINIGNFGTVSIGGLTAMVDGLDVLTSGDIIFTNFGSIVLSDETGPETIHGGTSSGNVILTANGVDSDIIPNIDQDSISAPRGNIVLTAGSDIAFGLIGTNFDNDARANGTIVFNAGRDILLDGFADIVSDAFGQGTAGNVVFNAGRNITLLAVAGTDAGIEASGTAGGDIILNTGPGGTVTLNSGNGTAPFASLISSSGDITLNADRLVMGANGAISSVIGEVTVRPITAGRAINLGSVTDTAIALEISDAEIDRIFTANLNLGGINSGPLTVSSAISPLNAINLVLRSGTDIMINSSMTVGGALAVRAGDNLFVLAAAALNIGASFTGFVDEAGDDGNIGGISIFNGTVNAVSAIFNGNAEADTLNGSGSVDMLFGMGGNDTLRGFGGNDLLSGGAGTDTTNGGFGNDSHVVDSASDIVQEQVGEGNDSVLASVSYALAAGASVETLQTTNGGGTGTINLIGNELANSIFGNEGVNQLLGGAGVDQLLGNGGNDVLVGGFGADVLRGGTGNDVYGIDDQDQIFENVGEGDDSLAADVSSYFLTPGASVETLTTANQAGTFAQNLTGNEFGQSISGSEGANVLNGLGGMDLLRGYGGADIFLFDTAPGAANADVIADMALGVDKIALQNAVFTGLSEGNLGAGAFRVGSAAQDADDRIIYDQATGRLFFDSDGNGGNGQVLFAIVNGNPALAASDFIVV